MAVFGKYFTYNGKSSEEFGLIIAGFQNVDTPLGLARDWSQSSLNKYRNRVNTYGINYNSTLSFRIQLIKDPCVYKTEEAMRLNRDDIRRITAWLTSPITPRLFHMHDFPNITQEAVTEEVENPDTGEMEEVTTVVDVDHGEAEYDYMGLFTNVTAQDNNVYSLECTFECNTPYALSQEQRVIITDGSGVVNNPSDDLEDYVYPVIEIWPTNDINSTYSIRLINETDDNKSITLNKMAYHQKVTMDCQKMTVKTNSGNLVSFEDLNVDVVDYIYWFRLLPGANNISVTGDADVTFIFRYPVKVGAY